MTIQISVPSPGPSLSRGRRPKFVSASTKSLVLMVDGSKNKSVDITSGTTTVTMQAPFGSHVLAINLYDDTTANGNGDLLSTGCLSQLNSTPLTNGTANYSATGVSGCDSVTLSPGTAYTATAPLRGVVNGVQLTFSGAVTTAGATTANLTIVALDNADNVITTDATHPFANLITLSKDAGCTGTLPPSLNANPGVTYPLTVPNGTFLCTVTATAAGTAFTTNLVNNATLISSGIKVYVSTVTTPTIVTVLIDPANAAANGIGATYSLPAGTVPQGIANGPNDPNGPTPSAEDPLWVANAPAGSFGNVDFDGPDDTLVCTHGHCGITSAANPYITSISSPGGTPFGVHATTDNLELIMAATLGAKLSGPQNITSAGTTCNVTADKNGTTYVLYATDCATAIRWATQSAGSGTLTTGLSGITGLAHDPANHRLFVATGTAITAYDISGAIGTATALSPAISLTAATGYHAVDGGSGRGMRAVSNGTGTDLAWANDATTVGLCLGYVANGTCAKSLSWNVGAPPVRVEIDSAHNFVYATTYDGKLHIYNMVGAPTSGSVTDTGSISVGTTAFGLTF